jgi:hypothetical protein
MKTLTTTSRAIIEFELEWESEDAHHLDGYWADPVNFWRDCLDQSLIASLVGQPVGTKIDVEVAKAAFHTPYKDGLQKSIKPA